MSLSDELKRQAAIKAVEYFRSETAVGLGTGSTMRYVLEELSQRLADGVLHAIVGIPTSEQTAHYATELGIPLTTFDDQIELDLTMDGADEIDPQLNLIKGLGGALLREKIVASAARKFVVVADASKRVALLGTHTPLPIEVVSLALPLVVRRLTKDGRHAPVRRDDTGEYLVTDEGNYILDYACGPLDDPQALNDALLAVPGIVEHGLFLGMATTAIIAGQDGIDILET